LARILAAVEQADETDDLLEPFLLLATTAFQGFELTLESHFVIDDLLERAQLLSEALAIGTEERH
jgi:hypothetical protein